MKSIRPKKGTGSTMGAGVVMRQSLAIILSVVTVCTALADEAGETLEQLVRTGNAVQALEMLREGRGASTPAETSYWVGRAFMELGRYGEAVARFREVPETHPLYPYAARGMLYCAKHSSGFEYKDIAEELTQSANEQVSYLARIILIEQQIIHAKTLGEKTTAYKELKKEAQGNSKLQSFAKLMGVYMYAQTGDYTAGINYARELENDRTLDTAAHHYLRLMLAELFYEREKAEEDGGTETPHREYEAEEEEVPADAYGMGEESLLQFITAYPESPILRDAFVRLRAHENGDHSAYTRSKLSEWAENTTHPRRAAYALLMLMESEGARGGDTSAYANRAMTDLPGEPLTRVIVQEHIWHLFRMNKKEQAKYYIELLNGVAQDDAYTLYLRAMLAEDDPQHAAKLFEQSAAIGSDELRAHALANALICHARAGNKQAADKLLAEETDATTRRSLLLTHAEMLPAGEAVECMRELQEVQQLEPNTEQSTRVMLCGIRATLVRDPKLALKMLSGVSSEQRATWSQEDVLLYAALLEKAADESVPKDTRRASSLLQKLYEETSRFPLKRDLGLHLAERLSANQRHQDAAKILLNLAQLQSGERDKAVTLFLAGRECAACGTLPTLQHAVRLFAECARITGTLASDATIFQAEILTRINRCRDAIELLEPLHTDSLTPAQQAHRLTVLADAYAFSPHNADMKRALATCASIRDIPDLSHPWKMRASLQHGILATRAGEHEVALQDYMDVLREHDEGKIPLDASCVPIYYFAGAGAVYRLLCMNRFEEAAALCDRIAAWCGTSGTPAPCDPSKAAAFSAWAGDIRRTNFLPTDRKTEPQSLRECPPPPPHF